MTECRKETLLRCYILYLLLCVFVGVFQLRIYGKIMFSDVASLECEEVETNSESFAYRKDS